MEEQIKKLGEESIFPSSHESFVGFGPDRRPITTLITNLGMSKRFYAACVAMQGLIAGCDVNAGGFDAEWTAKTAFNMADKLLKQENDENNLQIN